MPKINWQLISFGGGDGESKIATETSTGETSHNTSVSFVITNEDKKNPQIVELRPPMSWPIFFLAGKL